MRRKGAASNVVLPQPSLARTRRPVKDKGALMQTLRLRLQDLRAISLGQSPGRWPTPSAAMRGGTKGPPGLSNSPVPTSAVGSRPARSHQRLARCPTVGAGLPLASPLREVSRPGADAPLRYLVCPRQTASELSPYPAPHVAGDLGADHWQARASKSQRLASGGLSFALVPRRGKARSIGEKTADPVAHVEAWAGVSSGALCRHSRHSRGEDAWPATTSL